MRVNDKFFGCAFVKILVTFWCIIQVDQLNIYGISNVNLVVEDSLGEVSVVPLKRVNNFSSTRSHTSSLDTVQCGKSDS